MKEQILKTLAPGHPWGELLQYYPCLDSTNTFAKALALRGAPHGTVIIAGSQTGGRGRMGRSFHSPEGTGLYFTAILRPDCEAAELMHLTCAVAVAVADAIESVCGVKAGIKWTNDLVCGTRKVAGILTELVLVPGSAKVAAAIVGIGINCRQTLEDFPPELRSIAGSLSMAAGQDVSPATLAAAIMEQLSGLDGHLLTKKSAIMDRYRLRCITLGREVSLHKADTVTHAIAVGVDDEGALVVEYPDGRREVVSSGEASIRGMYGYV
jgi:BirA family biotin operon repressor/biotin-[acetyl-CoA-carboxylase] ligase